MEKKLWNLEWNCIYQETSNFNYLHMKTNLWRVSALMLLAIVFLGGKLSAQPVTVKGKVTSGEDGLALAGVTVMEKGSLNGTVTDMTGEYSLQTSNGKILAFSYIGYVRQEIKVTGERIDVVLQADQSMLSECVVIGYSTAKKSMLTGSVSSVNQGYSSGRVAGVHIYKEESREEYNPISENRFKSAKEDPLSTFSIDVDVASYSNMRRFVNQGQIPPADAIRTEELINYFSYNYTRPTGNDPVRISAEAGDCPWNKQHRLVRVGIKAKEIDSENLPASNLVFLIDVSGSMYGPARLELVKSSLKLLINNLRDKDKVAIVVYAGSAGEVLSSTPGSDKQKIREALDQLTAGGSTAGGAGIQLAYKIARNNFIENGNNRIILCTDGDFNVGVSSKEGLESLIEQERKSGVYLTILGYGMGNYKDNRMQVLAEKGNGNHAYIDNLQEANKVLVSEFGGTIHTVAKDVKLQLEFNPAHVQAYRLIGYESRLLNKEDFNDDTKDAGEMGAGHSVTAFYEVIPVGVKSNFGNVDELKYQQTQKIEKKINDSNELLTIKLRYKKPDGHSSKKIEFPLVDDGKNNVSSDFRFATAVALFGQLLHQSDFTAGASYEQVVQLAQTALDNDVRGYRREFIRLAETVNNMLK